MGESQGDQSSPEEPMPKEGKYYVVLWVAVYMSYTLYIDIPKGRRDVDFPFDDYFMALAVLAKVRSPYPKPVYIYDNKIRCIIYTY